MKEVIILLISLFAIGVGGYSYWRSKQLKVNLEKRESEMKRRMYEIAILKELGDRIGYSLNVENIIDIITGSLHQFLEFGVTSYMLFEQDKIIFKIHLEKSVSRSFVDDIKKRMLGSLSALLNKDFAKTRIEEIVSGAITVEEVNEPVRSFFNIPLIIGEKVVGVLTIAHTKNGLYKEEEMTILYKIVKQASMAVTRLQNVVEIEEEKLNAMVESMIEGVVMTDKSYKVIVVNPAAKKVVGIEKKEDASIFDFIDSLEGKFDIRGKLEESVKLDKILTSEDVLINDHFYQIAVSPVKSNLGENKDTLGGVVIFHDITHEKEVEQMREDFTHMIVHELRSPLNSSSKMIELIKGGSAKKEKESEYLGDIDKSITEMLELVNNLLDAAKVNSGKFEIAKQPFNIKEVIDQRVSFFKDIAESEKIELSSVYGEGLPEKLEFDRSRIFQTLNNYITNSLKYSDSGAKVTIQAIMHKQGEDVKKEAKLAGINWFIKDSNKKLSNLPNSVLVGVTDNGMGIPKQHINELFSKFKQLIDTGQEGKKKGTGLGLTIVKGIIEAHGGIVGVESIEGEGSTFYFTLPVNNLDTKK